MLPFVFFFLGLLFLFRKNYAAVLTNIMILSTTFLQLQFDEGIVPETYNVTDVGYALYILFFIVVAIKYGVVLTGRIQNAVTVFFLFLIINGIYDIELGCPVGDVIRYVRNWVLMSVVYIAPYVKRSIAIESFKHLYYITLFICLVVSIGSLLNNGFGIFGVSVSDRGIKPPPYCMIFSVIALMNVFSISNNKRYIHFFIFVLPIILNMKMTYAVTVFLILVLYILNDSRFSLKHKIIGVSFVIVSSIAVIAYSGNFGERFTSMTHEIGDIAENEQSGNFSYRILHAMERYEYISQDPVRYIRGMGYISEKHLKGPIFYLGTHNGESQLDTGDIAWSLFFLRLGMLGIFLYLIVYFRFLKEFWKMRKDELCYYMFCMMVVYLFFTSLGNALIVYSDYFIFPALFLLNKKVVERKNRI